MNDPRLLQQIDACRGPADLTAPDMAALHEELAGDSAARGLFERVQRLDGAIGAAMEDVPVPEGLSARILAALAGPVDGKLPDDVAAMPVSSLPAVRWRSNWRRRNWRIAAGVFTSAAAVLLALYLGGVIGGLPPVQTAEGLQQGAIELFRQPQDPMTPGVEVNWNVPVKFPYSTQVKKVRGTRQRTVPRFLGHTGQCVAYDFLEIREVVATLYVSRIPAQGLPPMPERSPFSTQGHCASAWSEGGYVYVLVVHGDAETYRGFLNPRGNIA